MNTRPLDDDGFDHEPPSADVQAGEYVLGVLDARDRRAAEDRIARDADFAARVGAWEHLLGPWLWTVAPVQPGVQVWARVRTAIGLSPVGAPPARWWQRVGVWQGATALATAAAIAAVMVGRVPQPAAPATPPVAVVDRPAAATPAPTPKPVTRLMHEDGSPGWLAAVDPGAGTVTVTPMPHDEPAAGQAGELWVIAPGHAPMSLGVVSMTHMHTVAVPAAARAMLVPGALLAITMEPAAGMPHAAPTGAIVAKGEVALG